MTARASTAQTANVCLSTRRPAQVRAMIGRFQASERARLTRLVASHRYAEDLLWSFPGLLFALASPAVAAEARAEALGMIVAGAPLADAAGILGVPVWLRKMPPEAFQGALPRLPDTPSFAFRIANHMPADAKDANRWLNTVAAAHQACNEDFALWMAREFGKFDAKAGGEIIPALGLFAWATMRGDIEPALLMPRPWCWEMGAPEACSALRNWLVALEIPLYRNIREARLACVNPEANVHGISFVRLRTLRDLEEEGAAMNHCIASYGATLARACSVLYSLREGDRRVATLQVTFGAHRTSAPAIRQLSGAGNAKVPHHVLQAVYTWLAGWQEVPENMLRCGCVSAADQRVWQRYWKPYWLAKGVTAMLPIRAPADLFRNEHRALDWCLKR